MPHELEIINHDFLVTDNLDDSSRHRYFRQDGYAISPKLYNRADLVRDFDLKHDKYSTFIRKVSFVIDDLSEIELDERDIYDEDDFLPKGIQHILRGMAYEFEIEDDPLDKYLLDKIDRIYPRMPSLS